ncbi:MAG TPA: hypothetical protein VGG29_06390 [Caulobacteraceae bacterium]|jgi:hypothetical protein
MIPTAETRKPVDRLTIEDLETFAIWEFADDEEHIEGRDETWVRPLAVDRIPSRIGPYAVRAELVAATGEVLPGLVWVTTDDGFSADAAATLQGDEYRYLNGDVETATLFPISYQLDVVFDSEARPRVGLIPRPPPLLT